MTDQEFNELVRGTRLSSISREAARLVFVEGRKQVEAAAEMGLSKVRMNQIYKTVERLEQEREQRKAPPDSQGLVAAVEASYAFAVKAAREQLGDEVRIQTPGDAARTVGPIVARTDFHLVQSLGKETVAIHELAKLERVPPLGRNVAIQYEQGRGAVIDRSQERQRGGHAR